jgi:mRNA interferase MazF
MGEVVVARGDVWWGESPDEKGRPYLVISRDRAIEVMPRVLVVPVTRTIRGLPSELDLGPGEGLLAPSVANFDNIRVFPRSMLVRWLGALGVTRRHELCAAAAATMDC